MSCGADLCKPIAAAIACGGLMITNQLRTLTHVAIAAVGDTTLLPDYNWFRRRTFWLRY